LRLALAFLVLAGCARSPERTLVVAYPRGLQSLDLYAPVHEQFAANIQAQVYEPLVEVGPDLSLRPALAASWHSPDDLTWVFTLRPGVRLHDGRLLTAALVARSFERARHEAWTAGELEPVTRVEARGELDVVFSLGSSFAALPSRLTYLFVEGARPAAGGASPGTGPYRIAAWRPGSVVLEAFDAYRGGPPPIRRVEIRSVPDPRERARLLRSGAADLIADVLPDDMASLAHEPRVRTLALPGRRLVYLAMDVTGRFADRRLREAVAQGVDRAALAQGALRGFATPVEQIPGPGDVGHDPQLPARGHDPAAAARLLAQAGFPGGLDVDLDYMRGSGDDLVGPLAQQLARIGLRARPNPLDSADFLARVEQRRSPFYMMRWLNETGSAQDAYAALLHSSGPGLGVMNGGRFARPAFDELVDRAARTSDAEERGEALRAATRLVHDDLPVVTLLAPQDLLACAADLQVEPHQSRRFDLRQVHFRTP
jgi:peptide/nickel transport system substrate-binding protein